MHKQMGPYKVVKKVGNLDYKLELPTNMHIHNIFHISLLQAYKENMIPGRVIPPMPPVKVEGEEEYEVEKILDLRLWQGKL